MGVHVSHSIEHARVDAYPEFSGRSVVITGAAGQIGGWIADAFARYGADLVLVDREIKKLEDDRLSGRWPDVRVLICECDLLDMEQLHATVRTIEDEVSSPYALINNAGVYPQGDLFQLEHDDWQRIMGLNVTAPLILTQQISSQMIRDGVRGSIVNILSARASTVSATSIAYSTSKAALSMLTRGTALSLGPHGIRVNAVSPGFVPGGANNPFSEEYIDRVTRSTPLGRTSGPEDAPELIAFLCSDRASFITGALLPVDGGRSAGPTV